MNSRKLNIQTENWREEPFSISRSYEDNFDVVVLIDASESERTQRLIQTRGLSAKEAERLIRIQI